MSRLPINRSPDLQRLREEGYAVEIYKGHLLIRDVPYVNGETKVKRDGILVSTLALAGDVTAKPDNHTAWFVGDLPCDRDGRPLSNILNGSGEFPIADGLKADHIFSRKPVPSGAYDDYHQKMVAYIKVISAPAQALDPEATPLTHRIPESADPDSVFEYEDTASSRAQITAITEKLKTSKVAIVGLGGTGSYILDLVAKTPVAEIHLYDGDDFLSHNALRGPGVASLDELRERPIKVTHWRDRYSKLHRKIYAHEDPVSEDNVGELAAMSFVFLAMDRGPGWKMIVEKLQEWEIPFVDVGMGLFEANGSIGGQVRTTASTGEHQLRVPEGDGPAAAGDNQDEYEQNIQIAELNALNAALAVIRWKKHLGFYLDFDHEHSAIYVIDGNVILNKDRAA